MKIEGIIWLRDVVDKLATKHHVEPDEVEEVLNPDPTKTDQAVDSQELYVARERNQMDGYS